MGSRQTATKPLVKCVSSGDSLSLWCSLSPTKKNSAVNRDLGKIHLGDTDVEIFLLEPLGEKAQFLAVALGQAD
jgi:hypothetical protein